MFQTTDVNGHEIRKVSSRKINPNGSSSFRIGPTLRCMKCGMTAKSLTSFSWENESCREYLQKQYELSDMNSTNRARQRKFEHLEFEEVFEGCSDPLEYLERREVTVDTTFGEIPREWKNREPNTVLRDRKGTLSKIIESISIL